MAIAFDLAKVAADHWWVLLIRGILGIIFGLLFIFNQPFTLVFFILLFGAYAFVDGVFAGIQALRLGVHSDRWWPLVLETVLGIAAGILVLRWPGLSALAIAFTIAVWAIATGVLEIVAAFRFEGHGSAPWLLGLGGLLSIIVGLFFVFVPIPSLLAGVWVMGIYAIVFGVALVVMAFRLRTAGKALAT